jgi:hypothetical protein
MLSVMNAAVMLPFQKYRARRRQVGSAARYFRKDKITLPFLLLQ